MQKPLSLITKIFFVTVYNNKLTGDRHFKSCSYKLINLNLITWQLVPVGTGKLIYHQKQPSRYCNKLGNGVLCTCVIAPKSLVLVHQLPQCYKISLLIYLNPSTKFSLQKTNSNATHPSAGQLVFEINFLKSREIFGNQVSKYEIIHIFKTLLLFLVTLEGKISNQNN